MSLGESKGGLPPDDCVEDEAFILKDSQRVIERYHDASAGLDDADRAGPLLALLRHHDAAEGVGRACPALQGQAPHPSLRDPGRGALHARALPAPSGRLDGNAGLAGRGCLVRPCDPCRRRRDPEIRRDRLRRGPLPLLQHAARLRHRADQEIHGRRREGRSGRGRLGQQRCLQHPAGGPPGHAAGAAAARTAAAGRPAQAHVPVPIASGSRATNG